MEQKFTKNNQFKGEEDTDKYHILHTCSNKILNWITLVTHRTANERLADLWLHTCPFEVITNSLSM